MKTYLMILGLSTALSAGLPGPGNQRKACERLVLSGHTQAMSLKDTALQAKVKSLLARAEKQCLAGKRDTDITTARSAIGLIK
jgi:hypothetical protein